MSGYFSCHMGKEVSGQIEGRGATVMAEKDGLFLQEIELNSPCLRKSL